MIMGHSIPLMAQSMGNSILYRLKKDTSTNVSDRIDNAHHLSLTR
jgi:hypothetical protein